MTSPTKEPRTPLQRGKEFEVKHRDADHIIFKNGIMLGAVYTAPDIDLRQFFAEVREQDDQRAK